MIILKKKPCMVKVIRQKVNNGQTSWWSPQYIEDKYYSSFLYNKQHIYTFLNDTSIKECFNFLKEYKKIHGYYPDLNKFNNKVTPRDCNLDIYIYTEELDSIKEKCMSNGVGLVGISSFGYSFDEKFLNKNDVFNISISAMDLITDKNVQDYTDKQIDNLNYLLDL